MLLHVPHQCGGNRKRCGDGECRGDGFAEERFCRKEVADLYFSTLEEAQQTFDLLPFMATNICEAEMHEYDANHDFQ